MICQRCGLCCITMFVPIINNKGKMKMKPGDMICPHLSFEGAISKCVVHDDPMFMDSPCHIYGNSDVDPDFFPSKGKPCRVGQMVQSKGGYFLIRPSCKDLPYPTIDELELCDEA